MLPIIAAALSATLTFGAMFSTTAEAAPVEQPSQFSDFMGDEAIGYCIGMIGPQVDLAEKQGKQGLAFQLAVYGLILLEELPQDENGDPIYDDSVKYAGHVGYQNWRSALYGDQSRVDFVTGEIIECATLATQITEAAESGLDREVVNGVVIETQEI